MADSLLFPLAAKTPHYNSSLVFRNCPLSSCLLPPKSSLQFIASKNKLNVLALSRYSLLSLHHRAGPIRALESDVPHPLHKVQTKKPNSSKNQVTVSDKYLKKK